MPRIARYLILMMRTLPCLLAVLALPVHAAEPARSPEIPYQWSSVAMGGAGFVSGLVTHPTDPSLLYARTDVGGAYRFNRENDAWIPLLDWLPPANASAMGVEALALDPRDPRKVYLLTGTPYWRGGTSILRSGDQGQTWQRTDVSEQIRAHGNKWGRHTGERLVVDPNDGRILFCGSRNNGLWRSADYGCSWTQVSGLAPGAPIHRKGAKQPEHPATTNNGNGICFIVFDPASGTPDHPSTVLYAGLSRPRVQTYQDSEDREQRTGEGNIFQSTDAGRSWSALPPLPDVGLKEVTANAFFHPVRALVANRQLIVTFQAEKGWGGGIFRYDPASRSWADLTPLDGDKKDAQGKPMRHYGAYSGIDYMPGTPGRLIASSFGVYLPQRNVEGKTHWGERIFYSERGLAEDGSGWLDLFGKDRARLDPNIPFAHGATIHWGASVVLDRSNPSQAFITSGNGVWATPNLTDSMDPDPAKRTLWRMAVKNLEESVPMDVASIPNGPLVSLIWDYAGFTNEDPAQYGSRGRFQAVGGLNVRLASVGSGSTAKVIRFNSNGDIAWSTDSGVTWTALEKHQLGKAGTNGSIALSADAATILFTTADKTVHRHHDPGHQWPANGWQPVTDLQGAHLPVADPLDATRFYSFKGTTGELLASSDSGKTFQPVASVGHGANWRIRHAPGRSADVWIAMNAGGLARWHNGQVTRIPLFRCSTVGFGRSKEPGDYPVIFLWGRPLEGDPEGVYRSTDEGKTWFRINDDRHQYGDLANGGFVKGCMNVYGRVYRSTAGRGVVYGTPQK